MKETKVSILRKLFLSTLYISAFTFGGGFVIITFMKRKFVDELHWIDMTEMLDLAALAQSSPGAIAVNAAILVGWRVAGFAGMVTSVMERSCRPMMILSVISFCYQVFAANIYVALVLKGMQAGVAAVILDVVCGLGANVLKQKTPHIDWNYGRSVFSQCNLEDQCDLYHSCIGFDRYWIGGYGKKKG